jgi:hypothetical protein
MDPRPIDLVISDAGPLITLAVVGQLELLDLFQRPIVIPDVVQAECLSDRSKLGYPELVDWFDRKGNSLTIVETSVMKQYHEGLQQDRRDYAALKNLGEKAVSEVIAVLKANDPTDAIAVLIEDASAGDAMRRETGQELTILSTRAFLLGLELKGQIPSAANILALANVKGRSVAKYQRDQPERDSRGNRITDWTRNIPQGPHGGMES